MRKSLILLLFLALPCALSAQWYYTSLMAPTNVVTFVNSTTGIASTGFTLARTSDGGTTWNYVGSAAMDSIIISLSFPTENTGYASGLSGNLLKTTDGGNTWFHLSPGTGKNLRCVFFTDENNGYVAGDGNALFRTTDGGSTWQTLTSPVDMTWSMQFLTPTFGILAGNTRSIYRTQDGGAHWLEIAFDTPNKFMSVHFPDAQTGYACGWKDALTPCMIKSTDGGMKWSEVSVPVGKGLWAVRFIDNNVGYAGGVGGTIIRTTDGGASWVLQTTPDVGTINGLWFTDASHGFAAGAALWRTDNGGGSAGIPDQDAPAPLTIRPNPSSDRIFVNAPGNLEGGRVAVYDARGKKVLEEEMRELREGISVSPLAPGGYLIRVAGETGIYSGTFVKQ